MSEKAALKKLYKKIPEFSCVEGCNDCCGVVPVSPHEAKKLKITTNMTPVKLGTCDCIYSTSDGCTAYDNRPFMCRLFGAVEDLPCPHGKKPNKMLTSQQGRRLSDEYRKLCPIDIKQVDATVKHHLQ